MKTNRNLIFITTVILLASVCVTAQSGVHLVVSPNILVSREPDRMWEPMVAANPRDPKVLVGVGDASDMVTGVGRSMRAYYTSDGGNTWTTVRFPEVLAVGSAADPQVAFGPNGVVYFTFFVAPPGGSGAPSAGNYVFRSIDGGKTWEKTATLPLEDHPQIVVDQTGGRFDGRVYIGTAYHAGGGSNSFYKKPTELTNYTIGFYRSADNGRTWSGPVTVEHNNDRRDRGLQVHTPAVFSDGEIFVSISEFSAGRAYFSRFATSKDGGVTFSPSKVIPGTEGVSRGRSAIYTGDGKFRDRVYVVGEDHPDKRVRLVYSDDRGKTWSKPTFLDTSTQTYDRTPEIAVNKDGAVAVTWFGSRVAGGQAIVEYFMAVSIDGGVSFLPPVKLSSEPTPYRSGLWWVRHTPAFPGRTKSSQTIHFQYGIHARRQGHYMGMAADADGIFHPFWVDGRTGVAQVWTTSVRVRSEARRAEEAKVLATLAEASVTDMVDVVIDPPRDISRDGAVVLPVRIKNVSKQNIYGPFKVEVSAGPEGFAVLNSTNEKTGVGATVDYRGALRDADVLPPGGVTDAVLWKFKLPDRTNIDPLEGEDRLQLKIGARLVRGQN